MKKITILLSIISSVTLLALMVGCATTKQTEETLLQAGFKAVPAATAAQQAHLKTLPHKISTVQKAGKEYYVFPNVKQNVLYVGNAAQFEKYKSLLSAEEMQELKADQASAIQNQTSWEAWEVQSW